jgi:hypothetical protein
MQLSDIQSVCNHRSEHWKERSGLIDGLFYREQKISMNGIEHSMNDNAMKQALSRLGISGTISDFEDDMDFLQTAIDRKITTQQTLHERQKPTLIIYDYSSNQAKCIKTTQYKRLPDATLLNNFTQKFAIDEKRSWISDNKIALYTQSMDKLEVKNLISQGTLQKGDPVEFGMFFSNSETGNGSLNAQSSMFRVACTNGMLSSQVLDIISMKHIYTDILSRMVNAVQTLYQPEKYIAIFNRSASRPAITTMDNIPTYLTYAKVPKLHHEGILSQITTDPLGVSTEGINGWGIYNGITRYATHILPTLPQYEPMDQIAMLKNAYSLITI